MCRRASILLCSVALGETDELMSQPNVLFVITDQHRADHVGFMGNDVVATPRLDKLAAQSMVFENAWVTNPVCMPNRSTLMTGRMPSAHGVIFNDRSLDWSANTIARVFRQAGYRTGLLGKSHLQHGMSKNSVVPYRGAPVQGSALPDRWDQIEDFERYLEGTADDPEDFYGFDHIRLAIDHGARATGHHLRWALEKGGKLEDLFVEYDEGSPALKRSENWWQVYQPPYDAGLHSTSFVVDQTQAFIQAAEDEAKPWFAWVSFPDPHHPMTPPGEYFDRHKPADMVLPESRHDDLSQAPEHLRIYKDTHPTTQRNWVAPCGYGDDEILAEAIAATYGMIEMVDDGVGQILDTLDNMGVRENTVVVFTSDHGDMMGDHGLFLKGFMHYRGCLQVPMAISAPGMTPGRTRRLAASIDLPHTVLELCDLQEFDGMQGKSLVPVLNDPDVSVRDYVLIEDDVSNTTAKLTPIPNKTRTVITEELRFTRNSKGEEQLFDLADDPDEMRDIGSDAGRRTKMLEVMTEALISADDVARGAPALEPVQI